MMGTDSRRRNGTRDRIHATAAVLAACLIAGLLTAGCGKDKSGGSDGSDGSGTSGSGIGVVGGQQQPYHPCHDLARNAVEALVSNNSGAYGRCLVRPEDIRYIVTVQLPKAGVDFRGEDPEKVIPKLEEKCRTERAKTVEKMTELRKKMVASGVDWGEFEIVSLTFEPEGPKYRRRRRLGPDSKPIPPDPPPPLADAVLGEVQIIVKSAGQYYELKLDDCALGELGWISAEGLYFRGPSAPPGHEDARSDLASIGKAANVYMTRNRDTLPRTWADLVPHLGDNLDALVLAASGNLAPTWDAEAKKLIGEPDYLLVDYGPDVRRYRLRGSFESVLAYEKPGLSGGAGAYAVFLDGHTEWLDAKKLAEALTKAKAATQPARR